MMHNLKECLKNSINMPITCNLMNVYNMYKSPSQALITSTKLQMNTSKLVQTLTKIEYIESRVEYNPNTKTFPHRRKAIGFLLLFCSMHVHQTCG
jgi:hypothetical protein